MLAVATILKLLAEIALLALLGQWIVGLLSGRAKVSNPFYRVLQLVGLPWVRAARWLSPALVRDRHMPLWAALLLILLWVGAAIAKVSICLQIGVASCR